MVGFPRIDQIALQKRWVVTKCEIYRRTADDEIHRVKESTAWIRGAAGWLRFSAPLFILVAPVAGLLRGKQRVASAAATVRAGWRWLRLFNLLRGLGWR
jgi:hypothetical protein